MDCFGGQRKEDGRVVVEGLSLVAWGGHLVPLLSHGLAHLLLPFVVKDPEKSRPATGAYVESGTGIWSCHCKMAQERAQNESHVGSLTVP